MSELNSGKIKITNDGNIIMQFSNYHHVIDSDTELYYKHQADNVIAELEKNLSEIQSQKMQLEDDVALLRRNNAELKKACNDKDDWCLHTLKENRHHKYKRCLAVAERCKDKIDNPVQCDEHDDWLIITEYWEHWHKRWLDIAQKFKEVK